MIRKIGQAFVLDTAHTTYAFSILPGGHPEHLYYGRTIHIEHPDDLEILVEKHVFAPGNVNICEKENAGFSLEDVRLEMSSYGKGDIREPFVEAKPLRNAWLSGKVIQYLEYLLYSSDNQ